MNPRLTKLSQAYLNSAEYRGVSALAEASESELSPSGSRRGDDPRVQEPAFVACSLSRRARETSGQRHTTQKVCEIHSSQAAQEVEDPQVVPALFVLVCNVLQPRLAKPPCDSESWKFSDLRTPLEKVQPEYLTLRC